MANIKSTIQAGQRFHRWLVIGEVFIRKNRSAAKCRCDCGTIREVDTATLKNGNSKGCGCSRKEFIKIPGRLIVDDDKTKQSSEYSIWRTMQQRTENPNNKKYAQYGGRGISVCERWKDFNNFLDDMGRRPSKNHSIDRIDNSGNYEPSNCRWATKSEQARNTRSNRILTVNGISMCIAEWAQKIGIPASMISNRLSRGWSDESAVTTRPIDIGISIKLAREKRSSNSLARSNLKPKVERQ